MKATVALRSKREERALQRAQMAPMRPEWIYSRKGWNQYVREDVLPPDLSACPVRKSADRRNDSRLGYHGHLQLVQTEAVDVGVLDAFGAVVVNGHRRGGLLDRILDGPGGTGKSLLLRAIGRAVQRDIEDRAADMSTQIPVVHILAPADTDSKINWIWEIACFLGLNPEPLNENELLALRKYPDLSLPVNYVLETALTRLLLVDDIQRVAPEQLAPVLHYFDYLRNRLGITTVFCGTGAGDIVHEARSIADRYSVVAQQRDARFESRWGKDTAKEDPVRSLLPVTWLDAIPFHAQDKDAWLQVLAGYEKDLRLHNLSEHALTKHHQHLHDRTGGYFLHLSQLICQAATRAILTGTEDITLTELDAVSIGRGH
ncbi:ATP-binding protein [Streptomyces sp. OZ13]|uniref:ATP-binding protein n=1 Tax=Streptomyces sp. OZ13 TaxID=3452210 RepID=UPI003F886CDC